MQNRQKDELIRDILTVCNGGAPITKVMFHGYITHGQAKTYLSQLIEAGLAYQDKLDKKYYTTPKGMEYLAVSEKMAELFPVATRRAATAKQYLLFLS